MCCKEGAFLLPVDRAAKARPGFAESEAHARSWATGDGLLARLASELIAECRKQGTQAHLLFNNIISNGWARLPAESVARYELKRDAVLYDKRGANTAFLVDALEEAGFEAMAKKLGEQRKKVIEQRRAAAARAAAPPPASSSTAGAKPTKPKSDYRLVGGVEAAAEPAAKRKRPADLRPPVGPRAVAGGGGAVAGGGVVGRPSAGGPGASASASGGGGGKPAKAARGLEPSDHDVARAMLKVLKKAHAPLSLAQVAMAAKDQHQMTPWNLARWLQAVKRGQKARPGWFASHGDDMLGVGATPGVEPEREVTVIHDDDSDDGGGGVEKGGPGAGGGEALADLEEELFGNIDDL